MSPSRPFSLTGLLSSTLLLLASSPAAAQVHTDCQPLNRTDCPPNPAFGMSHDFQFNSTPARGTWETTVGPVDWTPDNGAAFTIKKKGDSPTIRTKFYIFFGRVEINMRAASGRGIISSMMMLSDDLDEIDWEFMGGNQSTASNNYFGKGVQDYNNAQYLDLGDSVVDKFHNYTTYWTKDALDFYIDGKKVRTLLPKDANNSYYYPQTPARVSLGIWAGGDPDQPKGVKEWAGGETDYSKGPYTMYVKNAHITDFSSGKEYSYGDKSGTWESIKVVSGNSTVQEVIHKGPEKTIADKWNDLSPVAKTAIYASAAGVAAIMAAALLFYFIRQRRIGARENKLADERQRQERLELEQFKKAGIDPDSFAEQGTEYNAKEMHQDGLVNSNSYSIPPSPSNEKAWATAGAAAGLGAAAAAGAGAVHGRSDEPLLANGAQTPRMQSPAPYNGAAYGMQPQDRMRSPGPMHPASPGGPPQSPLPAPPQNRSFSTPNPNMRHASPAPSMGGYSDMNRTQSPGPVGPPQRSFTSSGGYGNGGGGGGYNGGHQGYQGGQPGYGGNGNDGYWR